MIKEIQIVLTPKDASDKNLFLPVVAKKLACTVADISFWIEVRRSIDARQRYVKVNLTLKVALNETVNPFEEEIKKPEYKDVSNQKTVIVIGAGPAGLFAALRLIELGLKPIVFERGKDVSARKRDIAALARDQVVDPDSNYCFGEGGAGTFSDGKLYSRSKKRGDMRKILEVLHLHGAHESILVDAHPHIGTDKLAGIIEAIRKTILSSGGEVHFNTKVTDLIVTDNCIKGIQTADGAIYNAENVILATGHSARDIYYLLNDKNIQLEAKPFAMGVRAEHKQALIDSIQYHSPVRDPYLPAASYVLAKQVKERGVYSFCMCPGGHIVASMTNANEIVVNGMSSSQRNSIWANSGIVVEIKVEDTKEFSKFGVLAGLKYQEHLEQLAYKASNSGLFAPAQRLIDFVEGKTSKNTPPSSYLPGLVSSPMHEWLPVEIRKRLQDAFRLFGAQMRGYLTNDAIIVGVESRTSTPVKIPRNVETLEHVQVKGLYPCGEGAGYSGGIVSSAMDGEKCAEMIAKSN